jgi:hypothetical protein
MSLMLTFYYFKKAYYLINCSRCHAALPQGHKFPDANPNRRDKDWRFDRDFELENVIKYKTYCGINKLTERNLTHKVYQYYLFLYQISQMHLLPKELITVIASFNLATFKSYEIEMIAAAIKKDRSQSTQPKNAQESLLIETNHSKRSSTAIQNNESKIESSENDCACVLF